jgi:hypothetical protein
MEETGNKKYYLPLRTPKKRRRLLYFPCALGVLGGE